MQRSVVGDGWEKDRSAFFFFARLGLAMGRWVEKDRFFREVREEHVEHFGRFFICKVEMPHFFPFE